MAYQPIAPVIPNYGYQAEAISGNQAVTFTATDRKIIEERGGTVDKTRSFLDLLSKKPLMPEVENEETTIRPEQNIQELENRYKEHKKILKSSPIHMAKDRVEISDGSIPPEENVSIGAQSVPTEVMTKKAENPDSAEIKKIKEETIAIAKELELNPVELFEKIELEQKELYNLICRIKELHLKRLLTETQKEFITLSEEIKRITLVSIKPEAKSWLEAQLDSITHMAAEYKLRLLTSMQSLEFNAKRERNIFWLKKIVADSSSKNS
jgi:hypothetical protein